MERFKRLVMAACAVFVAVASVMPVLQVAAASPGSSASLSIAPKKNYVIDPGGSVKDKLTIRNLDSTATLDLSLRVVDFTFTDDGGTPRLFLAANAPQTTWSLKPFITIPKSVSIPPKGSKTLDMSVAIPANHGAGSYYSAIIYSSGAPGEGGNVGLSASGVTLVFATVPGQVNEDLKLQKLGAYDTSIRDSKKAYQFITAKEPDAIGYTLQNNGNVTEAPVGSITLTDLFGNKRTITEVNPNGSLALIGQTRTFAACLKIKAQDVNFDGAKSQAKTCTSPALWPGYYSVALDVFYGQNGNRTQEVIGKASFWYLPLWFIIVSIIVLAIVTYFAWKVVRAVRRKMYGGVKFSRSSKPTRRR